jgi:hypothetical protein
VVDRPDVSPCEGCGRRIDRAIGPETTLGQLSELCADGSIVQIALGVDPADETQSIGCLISRTTYASPTVDEPVVKVLVTSRWVP